MRLRTAGALVALAAGSAAAQVPMQQMPADPGFMGVVAGEIHAVASFTPPDFTLSTRPDEDHLVFYGKASDKLETVRCERHTSFAFVAAGNFTGRIQAGLCTNEVRTIRALANIAPRSLEAALARLPAITAEERRKAGLTTTRLEGPHRTEEHAFPVIAPGHATATQTVVVVAAGGRQAVVVQADTQKLCEGHGLREKTALCRDTRQALIAVARRLERRFALQ